MNRNTSACMGPTRLSQAFFKGLLPFQRQEIALPLRDVDEERGGSAAGGFFLLKINILLLGWTLFTLGGNCQLPLEGRGGSANARDALSNVNIHMTRRNLRNTSHESKSYKNITEVWQLGFFPYIFHTGERGQSVVSDSTNWFQTSGRMQPSHTFSLFSTSVVS